MFDDDFLFEDMGEKEKDSAAKVSEGRWSEATPLGVKKEGLDIVLTECIR